MSQSGEGQSYRPLQLFPCSLGGHDAPHRERESLPHLCTRAAPVFGTLWRIALY